MNRGLFLDRDGIINVDHGYVYRKKDFLFIPEIFDICRLFQDLAFKIFVITNQAGIARGFYDESDFAILSRWMTEEFAEMSIFLTAIYHCPHHPDFGPPCDCRKPAPGMIKKAIRDFQIDPERSVLIGDKDSDIESGLNAGVRTNFLISGNANISSRGPVFESHKALKRYLFSNMELFQ